VLQHSIISGSNDKLTWEKGGPASRKLRKASSDNQSSSIMFGTNGPNQTPKSAKCRETSMCRMTETAKRAVVAPSADLLLAAREK